MSASGEARAYRSNRLSAMYGKFGGLILAVLVGSLSACTTTQVMPTANSLPGSRSGTVDVLYSTPQRPYISVGIVSAKKYKPGFSDPTISDAVEQLRSAGASVGADAVIVRGTKGQSGRRMIDVEGEAIRYTDVAGLGNSASAESALSANGFASGRGCGKVSIISDSPDRAVYQAKCPSGATLLIECRATQCDAMN